MNYYNEIDPYCAQWLRNLIDAVNGTAELAVTLDDGATIVALIEATERSIATGRPVDPRPLMALA